MLLDIHPVLGSVLRNPTKSRNLENFSRDNSFYFVPEEEEIVGWLSNLGVLVHGSAIQYDYYLPVENNNLEEDFLAVFRK